MLFLCKCYETSLEGMQRIKPNLPSIYADSLLACVRSSFLSRACYYAQSRSSFFPAIPRSSFHRDFTGAFFNADILPFSRTAGYFCRRQILLCRTTTRTSVTALKTVSSRRRPAFNILILRCVGINYAKSLLMLSVSLLKVVV